MAKIERTRNATRNIIAGIALKMYQIIVPFIMRTAMIYLLGIQYVGLNSLFTSLLQVLNLAELGVGAAMVFSMYKPIAEDDEIVVCALMRLYRKYYFFIGLIIGIVGLIITPFIPLLINGTVPSDINVYVLYIINLLATVISYWLFAYKNSILQAHQRNDIISKVTIFTKTIEYIIQFLILIIYRNYYLYVIIILISQVMNNIITAYFANRLYPQFYPRGDIEPEKVKEINQRIKDLFTSKIGGIIYDSADTIVISTFLGLTTLAIYQNYFYILSAVSGFIAVVFSACTAGIGNSIVTETKEKNYSDLKKFTFIICWIAGFSAICLLCLYQPFMELWVGEDFMLAFPFVICFSVYIFIRQLNSLFNLYKDAAGMWHEDRYRPLVAAMTNLSLNLILVKMIGLYGVLLSTVLAILFVGMPWCVYNLFSVIFERKYLKQFIKRLLFYSFIVLLAGMITYFICLHVHTNIKWKLIINGGICLIIPNIIFLISYYKDPEFKNSVLLLDKITRGRFQLSKVVK